MWQQDSDQFTYWVIFKHDLHRGNQKFSCTCLYAEFIISWIFIISAMVTWVLVHCFLSRTVQWTSCQSMHVMCYWWGELQGHMGSLGSFSKLFFNWSVDPSYWLTFLWWNHSVNYICIGYFLCHSLLCNNSNEILPEVNDWWHQPVTFPQYVGGPQVFHTCSWHFSTL